MRTPAERRYHYRSGLALGLMALCMISAGLFRSSAAKGSLVVLAAISPGAAFIYIAWEFRRYLSALDELARRIQLESIAWTYLCGLAVTMLLGGLGLIYGWRWNPMWFILLEPVRAIWLYFVSRRYQ